MGPRSVTNHLAMLKLVRRVFPAQYSIVNTRLHRLSLDVQVKLYAAATVIIGVAGSGMTNILFSTPGSMVVEMVPQKKSGSWLDLDLPNGSRPWSEIPPYEHAKV